MVEISLDLTVNSPVDNMNNAGCEVVDEFQATVAMGFVSVVAESIT
jgi:hypothetical protein